MIRKAIEDYFRNKATEYFGFAKFYFFEYPEGTPPFRRGEFCYQFGGLLDAFADLFAPNEPTPESEEYQDEGVTRYF